MKHKVDSKYKNPDRFIAILKREVAAARRVAHSEHLSYISEHNGANARVEREVAAVWGKQVNMWKKNICDSIEADGLSIGLFDPGDTIILVGTVKQVTKYKDRSAKVLFDRVETRRVKNDIQTKG